MTSERKLIGTAPLKTEMATINSGQFGEICDGVWRDRTAVLTGRGILSGEVALVRAVYWRLCKAGVTPSNNVQSHSFEQTIATYQLVLGCMLELGASPPFDGAPILEKLVERYQNELRVSS